MQVLAQSLVNNNDDDDRSLWLFEPLNLAKEFWFIAGYKILCECWLAGGPIRCLNHLHFFHSYPQFIFPSEFLGKHLEHLHVWVLDSGRIAMEFSGNLYWVIYMLFPLGDLFYACVTRLVLDSCFGDFCFKLAHVGPPGLCNFTFKWKKSFPKRTPTTFYILREGILRSLLWFLSIGKNYWKAAKCKSTDFKISRENFSWNNLEVCWRFLLVGIQCVETI